VKRLILAGLVAIIGASPSGWAPFAKETAGLTGTAVTQEPRKQDDPVKLNATLVQIPTVVTDRKGKFVADLTRGDFTVLEDGKRQEVASFAAVKQPFSVVVILDTSNSAEDRLKAIQGTAGRFIHRLAPTDRAMVISFDNEIHQLTDFSSDQAELEREIKATESGFGKLLYEAVQRALEQLKEVEGRRAVVVFTDGVDLGSVGATAEGTSKMAEEIGAVIYTVKFNTRWWIESEARKQLAEHPQDPSQFPRDGRIPLPPDMGGPDPTPPGMPKPIRPRIEIGPPSPPTIVITDAAGRTTRIEKPAAPDPIKDNLDVLYGTADAYMDGLAVRTGGLMFNTETIHDIDAALLSIAEELRNQYMLGYYTPPKSSSGRRASKGKGGGYHKIKVDISRKDVLVRARPGYRDQPDKSDQ
jgi:VWFA-related protein